LFGILGLALADPMVAMIKVALESAAHTDEDGAGEVGGGGAVAVAATSESNNAT
jgi:hypothetical protein